MSFLILGAPPEFEGVVLVPPYARPMHSMHSIDPCIRAHCVRSWEAFRPGDGYNTTLFFTLAMEVDSVVSTAPVYTQHQLAQIADLVANGVSDADARAALQKGGWNTAAAFVVLFEENEVN